MLRKILRKIGHLEFIRFGVRDRIIRFFHNPDTSDSEEFQVPFFAGTYHGNFDTYLDWSVFYYGAYSRQEMNLLEDFVSVLDEPIFLDVGANVGHHTLFAAMRSKHVIAIEPFSDVSKKLENKLVTNRLDNVTLLKVAIGSENKVENYIPPTGQNTGTGSFADGVDKDEEGLKLPVRVGDELLVENGFDSIQFIKIDVEGFEPFVLQGLRETLERSRPLVFFEWTQGVRKIVTGDCRKLFPENYSFYVFVPDTVLLGIFRKRHYKLLSVGGDWPDGNILALPVEFVNRLKTDLSTSDAALRLFAS